MLDQYTQPTQPLNKQVSATTDANGAATFTFDSPPQSLTWTGTVQVPTANASAHLTAYLGQSGGLLLAAWSGRTAGGPVQVPGAQLVVTMAGGVPLTQYVCIWQGKSEDAAWAETPQALQTASVSTWSETFLVTHGTNAGIPFVMNIDPAWRAVRLFVPSGSTGVTVTGITTNIQYVTNVAMAANSYLDVPVDGGADSSVTVAISSGSGSYWVTALTSDAIVQVTTASDQPLPITGNVGISTPLDAVGSVLVDSQPGAATTGKSGVETLSAGGAQQAFSATFVPKYGVTIRYIAVGGTGFANIGFTSGVALTEQLANREFISLPWTVALSGIHWISTNTSDTLEWLAV